MATLIRPTVHLSSGFAADPWVWELQFTQSVSGRFHAAWKTTSLSPSVDKEHVFRSRVAPDWWFELSRALNDLDFAALPPLTQWGTWVDDAPVLSVERDQDGTRSRFSLFYAPNYWPAIPALTTSGLQLIVSILDPIVRRLHHG